MDRWEVERALRTSGLPAQARLIGFALLTRTDADTAVIPAKFTPSLAAIARDTGLSAASVKRYLNVLETGGWVTRGRSKRAAAEHMPTTYEMHLPPGLRESLGAERANPPGLRESQALGSVSPGAGLSVSHNQTGTRPKPEQKKSAKADPYASLPGFAEFWSAYPRRTEKRTAASAYRTALTRCGDAALLIKAAAAYRDQPGREPKYTKHPATWLNGDCWLDEAGESWPQSTGDRAFAQAAALKAQLRTNRSLP